MVLMPGLDVVNEAHDAVQGAQVLALLTEWDEFRWLDFASIAHAMSTPRALIDARNLLDPAAMRRRGFAYQGVGR
jgi:UDPglucose 6-dehydrogenase